MLIDENNRNNCFWMIYEWNKFCEIFKIFIFISGSKDIRVVCYYTNWSVYRPGTAKFSPQNINPYLCTHLIYAFGGFTKENTLKPFDKYQDIEKGELKIKFFTVQFGVLLKKGIFLYSLNWVGHLGNVIMFIQQSIYT